MSDELFRQELIAAVSNWHLASASDLVDVSLLPIVKRRVAQARADAWSEGYSDGRNDEQSRSIRRATNPYRQHAEERAL